MSADEFFHKNLKAPYTLNTTWISRPAKYKATVVLLHGLGSSSGMWRRIEKKLPEDVRCIAIDLLGYGNSPKPKFKTYDIKTQSLCLIATLIKLRMFQPVILVGHSLGALVSIDMTRRFPFAVRSLVLCSPPLYKPVDEQALHEQRLRRIYNMLANSKLARTTLVKVKPYKILNHGYNVDESNADIFFKTLLLSVVNQQSMEQIVKVKKPTHIFYGTLDPVVIPRNIRTAANANPFISYESIPLMSHDIIGSYKTKVVQEIEKQVNTSTPAHKTAGAK